MNKIPDKNRRDTSYYITILLLIIALGVESGWKSFFSEKDNTPVMNLEIAKKVFPNTQKIEKGMMQSHVFISGKDTIGSGFIEPGKRGYGGKIPLFIAIKEGRIAEVILLSNNETDEFLTYIANDSLLNRWTDMPLPDVLHARVNAVSGATISSQAIIKGIKKGVAHYLDEGHISKSVNVWNIIQDILFLVVILASLMMVFARPTKRFRLIYMLSVLLVIGVLTGKLFSLKLLYGWIANGISWGTNWYSVVLLTLALILPILKKPKFYCTYLCPMGAFQELINQISPFKRRSIHFRWNKISLGEVYLTLIWVSLLLGFQPELSDLEPFMVFSYKVVGILFFLAALIIGILSMFFNKPWCAVCPTGCLLDTITYKRSKN